MVCETWVRETIKQSQLCYAEARVEICKTIPGGQMSRGQGWNLKGNYKANFLIVPSVHCVCYLLLHSTNTSAKYSIKNLTYLRTYIYHPLYKGLLFSVSRHLQWIPPSLLELAIFHSIRSLKFLRITTMISQKLPPIYMVFRNEWMQPQKCYLWDSLSP